MKRGNRTNATTSAVSGSPLVSIIMPAYNVEKYIGDSIRSALAQSHRNIELIIVDDGSRDRTARVCQTWCRRDRRVRLIRARNGGVARARNIGIRSAKGEWIAFMDSDDLWKARKLERQLRAAREMGADVVYTGAWMFWNDRPERPEVPLGIRAGRFTSEAMLNACWEAVTSSLRRCSCRERSSAGRASSRKRAGSRERWKTGSSSSEWRIGEAAYFLGWKIAWFYIGSGRDRPQARMSLTIGEC